MKTTLHLVPLEDRLTPALTILFDYRFDTGFFTNHPDRIAIIKAAAQDVGARFADTLAAIPYPSTPSDLWTATFDRPSGLGQGESIDNLLVPANAIIVFVGARELFGDPTVESGDRQVFGSFAFNDLVLGRGQANSYGGTATDYSPWGGSISYDSIANWHFGLNPPDDPNEYDLYMATQKALFHILGFGASEAWTALGGFGAFTGPLAMSAYNNAPIPLTSGNYEWVEDTLYAGQRTLMDADLEDGERLLPTILDLAAMADIGWQVQDPTPPPPPAAPPPPVAPPAPIPPGKTLHIVGTGPGTNARFTVNDAATFTQLAKYEPYAAFGGAAGFRGGVRGTTVDINQDGVEDIIVGPGPGAPSEIKVYSGANFPVSPDTTLIASGYAFETSFTGGVFVSAGDINDDGWPDVIVTPDEGGGPRVRIISGKDRSVIADFYGIDDPNFRGGARTAVGDLNGDGNVDLVVAAGFGGGPRVAIFDGASLRPGLSPARLTHDFFLFEETLRNGAYVAVGDIDGDGYADLIGGGGPGGGPRIFILDGFDLTQTETHTVLSNFFAGDSSTRGGVTVAAKDFDGDLRADLITGAGSGSQSVVTTYLGSTMTSGGTPPEYQRYLVFESSFDGGVYVG